MHIIADVVTYVVAYMGWVLKVTFAPRPFIIYYASQTDFLIIPGSSTRALWQLSAETSSSETG
jgi:hypothetical protein